MTANLESFALVLNKPRFRNGANVNVEIIPAKSCHNGSTDERYRDLSRNPRRAMLSPGTRGKANCCEHQPSPGEKKGRNTGGKRERDGCNVPGVLLPCRNTVTRTQLLAYGTHTHTYKHTARPDSQPRKRLYPFPATPTGDGECQFWARLCTRRIR